MTTATGGAEEASAFSPEEMAQGEALFAIAWGFLKSVPALEFLPEADRPEIAFAGRSNVGKSSLINALVRRRSLARASNTPGRTQELNFFLAQDARPAFFLVDMPGYGFAKAPKGKVDDWTRLVKDYLRGRTTLGRVFLLIDARHGPKPIDIEIMELLDQSAVSYQLVLTKADKVSADALARAERATRALIEKHPAAFPEVITTSSETGLGLDLLRARIALTVAERA